MKRLKRRWLVKTCAFVLTSFALSAVANDNPPVAQCDTYLTMSAASFSSAIASKANAGVVSARLNSCEKYNVCSQLNGITNCSALLFNRGFDSNLAFNSAAAGSSSNNNSTSTNNNLGSYFQGAKTNNNTSSNVVTTNTKAPTPAYLGAGNTNKTKTKKETINWF